MNALSLTLKWRELVAMGLHVGNMFVNREASPIEAAETRMLCHWKKGSLDQALAPQVELQILVLFLEIMTKNDITTQIFQ